jgi:anthranilate phosphoribosyltransferase
MIRSVLWGAAGAARDIVVLNAAAALWLAGKAETPVDSAKLAAEAIDSGAARQLLARLVELTNA